MGRLRYLTKDIPEEIDDETHDELAEYFVDDAVGAVISLASEYLQIGEGIGALAVELEPEFVGWGNNDSRGEPGLCLPARATEAPGKAEENTGRLVRWAPPNAFDVLLTFEVRL